MKRKIYNCLIILVSAYFYLSISYNDLFKGNLFKVTKDLANIVSIEVFGMIYIGTFLYIYYNIIKQGKTKKGIFLSLGIFLGLALVSGLVYMIVIRFNIHITYNDLVLRMLLNVIFFILLILRHRCKEADEKHL